MSRGGTLLLRSGSWLLAGTAAAVSLRLSLCTLAAVHDRATAAGSPALLPLPDLLSAGSAGVLGVAVLWLLLVTAATVVEAATGRAVPAARALSPAVLRRLVLAGCGLAVATAGVAPATALSPGAGTHDDLSGLPLPDRTAGVVARPVGSVAAGPHASTRTHRVRTGESLWSIAASLLPVTAHARDVDLTWRRVYRANRVAVGDDPDLLRVGTVLRLPATTTSGDEPATPDRKDA